MRHGQQALLARTLEGADADGASSAAARSAG